MVPMAAPTSGDPSAYFGVKLAGAQLDAHCPAVMSAQLVPFRQLAHVLSGSPQVASQENPDEFKRQD